MQPNYMIRYDFDPTAGDISTTEENIFIGFSTQEKHGLLMYIRSEQNDYMSIDVNTNGNDTCISLPSVCFYAFVWVVYLLQLQIPVWSTDANPYLLETTLSHLNPVGSG